VREVIGLVAMSEEAQKVDYVIAADQIRLFLITIYLPRTRGTSSVAFALESSNVRAQLAKLPDGFSALKASTRCQRRM
jgi:hypothetical protein